MPDYYYGTVASISWIFGHYFYGGCHYSWLSREYYPYRLPNPKSSNPHLIYQDLYQPWRDRDAYDKMIAQTRLNLRKGVMVYEASGTIDSAKAARLKDICDSVNIAFFYPIVYRVDLSKIHRSRSNVAGSGLAGSAEVLVPDLQETEFDVLFLDYTVDIDFRRLVVDEYLGQNTTLPLDALRTLEARC